MFTVSCMTPQIMAADGGLSGQETPAIEEITVIGQKQIFDLRGRIIQSEDRAFGIFNELNDDDDYDIHCKAEAPTGSHIKRRMCLPNFFRRATADNALEFLGLIGGWSNYSVPSPSARSVFEYYNPILQKKVRELAMKNPELYDALRENYELNEELKKTRNAYHSLEE